MWRLTSRTLILAPCVAPAPVLKGGGKGEAGGGNPARPFVRYFTGQSFELVERLVVLEATVQLVVLAKNRVDTEGVELLRVDVVVGRNVGD